METNLHILHCFISSALSSSLHTVGIYLKLVDLMNEQIEK